MDIPWVKSEKFSIRGLNEKQGELTLWFKDDYVRLRKQVSESGLVWQQPTSGSEKSAFILKTLTLTLTWIISALLN